MVAEKWIILDGCGIKTSPTGIWRKTVFGDRVFRLRLQQRENLQSESRAYVAGGITF